MQEQPQRVAADRQPLHRADLASAARGRSRSRTGTAGELGRRRLRRREVLEEPERRRARAGHHRVRAPRPRERLERRVDLGPQRDRRGLQVVDEVLGIVQRRGALDDGVAELAPDHLELGLAPVLAEAVGLGVDLGGRQARVWGISTTPWAAGGGIGSTTSPAPETRQGRGWSCEGTSAPDRGREARSPSISPRARRSTAAASALPPPSPAATGTCLAISTRSGGDSQPASRRRARRLLDQVRARRSRGR